MIDKRTRNIQIFEDTADKCKKNDKLKSTITESNKKQYVVLENDSVVVSNEPTYDQPAKVVVSRKRSFEAAKQYTDMKVCVHNFASASNPGGGVTKGSTAQEEALCRCSTLYFNLTEGSVFKGFYAKHRDLLKFEKMNTKYNDDCIFTPSVVVFKTDDNSPEMMSEKDWYNVDVITCAAPNLRKKPSNTMNPHGGNTQLRISNDELFNVHIKRMSRILDIAKKEKVEAIILGAFGCGAFSNPPIVVANAMFEIVKKYRHDFKVIEFAIYCTPRDSTNFDIFSRKLGRM